MITFVTDWSPFRCGSVPTWQDKETLKHTGVALTRLPSHASVSNPDPLPTTYVPHAYRLVRCEKAQTTLTEKSAHNHGVDRTSFRKRARALARPCPIWRRASHICIHDFIPDSRGLLYVLISKLDRFQKFNSSTTLPRYCSSAWLGYDHITTSYLLWKLVVRASHLLTRLSQLHDQSRAA
jgi:hypothetical protein